MTMSETSHVKPLEPRQADAVEALTKRTVQRMIARFVLPAYAIAGVGIVGALYLNSHEQQSNLYHTCVLRAEGRANVRRFALNQQNQIDEFLKLGKPDSPGRVKALAIAAKTRAEIEHDYPASETSPAGCHKP
jgi:hypothetical protein